MRTRESTAGVTRPLARRLKRGDFFAEPVDSGGHLGFSFRVLGAGLLRVEALPGAWNERRGGLDFGFGGVRARRRYWQTTVDGRGDMARANGRNFVPVRMRENDMSQHKMLLPTVVIS